MTRPQPGDATLLIRKSQCLVRAGNPLAALQIVEEALAAGAGTPEQLTALASVLFHCGRPGAANELYARVAVLDPDNLESLRGLALGHRALGRIAEAEIAANQSLKKDPDDFEMYHLRSSLRRQSTASNHVPELERLLGRNLDNWRGRVQLGYALAKELEDLGEHDRSFARLREAASLRRSKMKYDVRQDIAMLREIQSAFTYAALTSRKEGGSPSTEPVFVVGLPRTGSTLVERILSSHPEVESRGELNTFALELERALSARHGNALSRRLQLPHFALMLNMSELGSGYVERVNQSGRSPRHFIDKMPINALYAGLIHLALPNAKIVLVERDPVDTCYAMYKFLFNNAYPFSYDLEEVAHYYLAHRDLMDYWSAVLPEQAFLRVQYERLVSDPGTQIPRMLNHLGLEMTAACLNFDRNPSASMTGSASQVRQPIYQSSVGMWRNYRKQLAPLLGVLGSGGVTVPAD
ncbi:MAG TPA: sulfotransferase [Steroidobacteraceae bacterium]|nr:sulfotransferase [Steroidobacteraceae bacterium]